MAILQAIRGAKEKMKKNRAFVLEEEPNVREMTVRLLQLFIPGTEIASAGSLKEALLIFDQARVAGFCFDVVVLDYGLPDGVGTDLIPAIRDGMPACKIVVASAWITDSGDGANEVEMRNAGPDALLSKPFNRETFRELLHSLGLV